VNASESETKIATRAFQWEWLGWVALAGIAVYFVSISWLKWSDPLIDFGPELYVPWRLANSALLFRDLDDNYASLA
jgi:hypothetical protein